MFCKLTIYLDFGRGFKIIDFLLFKGMLGWIQFASHKLYKMTRYHALKKAGVRYDIYQNIFARFGSLFCQIVCFGFNLLQGSFCRRFTIAQNGLTSAHFFYDCVVFCIMFAQKIFYPICQLWSIKRCLRMIKYYLVRPIV